MSDFAWISLLVVAALFLVDYYVFRNWKRFVGFRQRKGLKRTFGWTLPIYRVLMGIMPFAMPFYFALWRWWEVEPKLIRAIMIGIWAVYYVPKFVIALILLIKDLIGFISWLFAWFQQQLTTPAPATEPASVPSENSLDLTDMKRLKRRDFLQQMGWTAASVPFVVVGYGVFRTLYDFQIHRVSVPIPNLPSALEGVTIAQLSDLHAGSFFSERPMLEAAHAVNDLRPDIVALTGDYVNRDASELGLILPGLQALRADTGIYGCLGNHDHYGNVGAVIEQIRTQTNIDLLVNQGRSLTIDGATLHILGTDNTGLGQRFANLPRAVEDLVANPNGDEVHLLLAHDPTFWDNHVRPRQPDIDLTLSGHTHGGQVGVEVGPLRWGLARVAYARWAGRYTETRPDGLPHHLYVNRGLGTVGPPMRLGIRPEITLLTLTRA